MLAVFDIDGVVADVRHRLHHLERRRWLRFFEAADEDTVLPEGAALESNTWRPEGNGVLWCVDLPAGNVTLRLRRQS